MFQVSRVKSILMTSAVGVMIAASPASAIVFNGETGSASEYNALLDGFGSVGQFHTTDGNYRYAGSGVAIANNWVLTAGHVAAGMNSMDFYLDGGGDFDSFGSRSTSDDAYSALSWITHPKWSGNLSSGYDIALVKFDNASFANTASLYQGSDEVGEIGTMVGFGMTGDGTTGATTFDGLKRAGLNRIGDLYDTPGKRSNPDRILLADFDSGKTSDDSFGDEDPLALEAMIASGDSGGGLFIDTIHCGNGSDPCLAGITSFGWGRLDGNPDSDFGDVGGFTRVSALYDWIMSIIAPSETSGGGGGGNNNGKRGGPKANSGFSFAATSVAVPEPGTLAIFGIGLVGLGFMRRRKQAS